MDTKVSRTLWGSPVSSHVVLSLESTPVFRMAGFSMSSRIPSIAVTDKHYSIMYHHLDSSLPFGKGLLIFYPSRYLASFSALTVLSDICEYVISSVQDRDYVFFSLRKLFNPLPINDYTWGWWSLGNFTIKRALFLTHLKHFVIYIYITSMKFGTGERMLKSREVYALISAKM